MRASGFLKLWVPFWGSLIARTITYWDPYWVPNFGELPCGVYEVMPCDGLKMELVGEASVRRTSSMEYRRPEDLELIAAALCHQLLAISGLDELLKNQVEKKLPGNELNSCHPSADRISQATLY